MSAVRIHRPRRWGAMALLLATLGALPLDAAAADTATSTLRINLRSAPDLGSRIVAQLQRGDAVTVLDNDGDFVRVRTAAGTVGFVKRKYLALAAPKTHATPPLPAAATAAPPDPPDVERRAPRPEPEPEAANARVAAPQATLAPAPEPAAAPAPVAAAPVPTAAPARWYLRAGLGMFESKRDAFDHGEHLRAEGFPVFIDNVDDEAPQLSVQFGYRLLRHLSVEAGLLHLQDLGVELTVDNPAITDRARLLRRLEEELPATGTGATLAAVGHWDVGRWRLAARAGYYAGLLREVDITVDGQTVTLKPGADAPLLGAGVDYALRPRWRLGLDYQALDLNDDLAAWSATLSYHP